MWPDWIVDSAKDIKALFKQSGTKEVDIKLICHIIWKRLFEYINDNGTWR